MADNARSRPKGRKAVVVDASESVGRTNRRRRTPRGADQPNLTLQSAGSGQNASISPAAPPDRLSGTADIPPITNDNPFPISDHFRYQQRWTLDGQLLNDSAGLQSIADQCLRVQDNAPEAVLPVHPGLLPRTTDEWVLKNYGISNTPDLFEPLFETRNEEVDDSFRSLLAGDDFSVGGGDDLDIYSYLLNKSKIHEATEDVVTGANPFALDEEFNPIPDYGINNNSASVEQSGIESLVEEPEIETLDQIIAGLADPVNGPYAEGFAAGTLGQATLQDGRVPFEDLLDVATPAGGVHQDVDNYHCEGTLYADTFVQEAETLAREAGLLPLGAQSVAQGAEVVAQGVEVVAQDALVVAEEAKAVAPKTEVVAPAGTSIYIPYRSLFKNAEEARQHREKSGAWPRFSRDTDETIEKVKSQMDAFVEHLYYAMINTDDVNDEPTAAGVKRFKNGHHTGKDIEARCWEIVVRSIRHNWQFT
jgi:hypothetical protein